MYAILTYTAIRPLDYFACELESVTALMRTCTVHKLSRNNFLPNNSHIKRESVVIRENILPSVRDENINYTHQLS